MGLILPQITEVGIGGKNIKYYEDLGYNVPKHLSKGVLRYSIGSKIEVNVLDLHSNSNAKVYVKCDCCGELLHIPNQSYNDYKHDDGKYYCKLCAINLFQSGTNHPRYKPDKTDEERLIDRSYPEYKEFVKYVMARDKYMCQCCRKQSGELDVHHLDGYDWCKDKRTDVNNGITLCRNCHYNFHSIYGFGNNTKQQFEEWAKKSIDKFESFDGELPKAKRVYCVEDDSFYEDAISASEYYELHFGTVYNSCNNKRATSNGLHFLWENDYENMSIEEIEEYKSSFANNKKRVICVTTGEIFEQIRHASKKYNVVETSISANCRGKNKSAGKLPDGNPLMWMYYNDYLKKIKSNEEINTTYISKCNKKVICITTGKIFNNIMDASRYYGASNTTISKVCKGLKRYKTSGTLKDGTKLKWMFYDDFLNLSKHEQQNILENAIES